MARPGCAEQAVLSVCCPTYTLPQRRFQSRHLAPQLHAVKNRVIHSTKDYRLSPICFDSLLLIALTEHRIDQISILLTFSSKKHELTTWSPYPHRSTVVYGASGQVLVGVAALAAYASSPRRLSYVFLPDVARCSPRFFRLVHFGTHTSSI
jgi:hypothetical protein